MNESMIIGIASYHGGNLVMTPKASRYVAGAAAGIAVVLSLTACKSAEQHTATGGGRPAGGGVRLTAAQEALAKVSNQTSDLTSLRGTVSYAASANGRRMGMKGRLAVRVKPALAMRLDVPSADLGGGKIHGLTEILAGDRLYLKMPGVQAGTGKPWVSITLSQLGAAEGADLGSMTSQGDLSQSTKMLTASKDVRLLGKETVGGVSTTHYQGTFDMRDGLAKLSGRQRTQAQRSFGAVGFEKMDFDVWVDGRQLPRKMTLMSPPGAKTATRLSVTYSAFNVPVAISPPPEGLVADGSGLLPGGGANVPG
jgi:hypothetical protein